MLIILWKGDINASWVRRETEFFSDCHTNFYLTAATVASLDVEVSLFWFTEAGDGQLTKEQMRHNKKSELIENSNNNNRPNEKLAGSEGTTFTFPLKEVASLLLAFSRITMECFSLLNGCASRWIIISLAFYTWLCHKDTSVKKKSCKSEHVPVSSVLRLIIMRHWIRN